MSPKFQTLSRAACFAFLIASAPVMADDALYPNALPDDAVFVRSFVSQDTTPEIDGVRIPSLDAATCRDFCALSAADLTTLAPRSYVSVIQTHDGSVQVIEEPPRAAKSKVNLLVINAGDHPVRLVVADRDIEVVAPVQPSAAGSRAVNPVTAKLAVTSVDQPTVLATFDVALSRGQDLTFLVNGNDVDMIVDGYGPVLKAE